MSRPSIQHSNITYYAIQRQKNRISQELEELSEPIEIKKPRLKNDRINISKLSDTFCPPSLTKPFQSDKLYTSPQLGETK